jgi:hypothetical protein
MTVRGTGRVPHCDWFAVSGNQLVCYVIRPLGYAVGWLFLSSHGSLWRDRPFLLYVTFRLLYMAARRINLFDCVEPSYFERNTFERTALNELVYLLNPAKYFAEHGTVPVYWC